MAIEQSKRVVTLPASGDLSTKQFTFGVVNSSGQVAQQTSSGGRADGVIDNKPTAAGQATELAIEGLTKVAFGGAVTPGVEVMSNTTGQAITATATNYVAGIFVGTAAAASGDIAPVILKTYKI